MEILEKFPLDIVAFYGYKQNDFHFNISMKSHIEKHIIIIGNYMEILETFPLEILAFYGYKQNDFHFNISMKSHIMNISLS